MYYPCFLSACEDRTRASCKQGGWGSGSSGDWKWETGPISGKARISSCKSGEKKGQCPFSPSAFSDKLFSLNDYYHLKYCLNEYWEKDYKGSLQSSQMKKEVPCKLWNSEKVCDPKLLNICKIPLLEIWWSPNVYTSKDTVNMFMNAIHRSVIFFSLVMYETINTHDIHSLQVFSVGTSQNVVIHSIRKVVLYQWWNM